jgi:hypothetical protein
MFDTIPIRIHTGLENLKSLVELLYHREVFWCGHPTTIREIMLGAEGYKHSYGDNIAITIYRQAGKIRYIFDSANGAESQTYLADSGDIPTVGYNEFVDNKTVNLDDFDQLF